MSKRCRPRLVWLFFGILVGQAGCTSQDEDCLARVGQKLADKAEALAAHSKRQLSKQFPALASPGEESSLEKRVGAGLRNDKLLSDATIQVRVVDHGVELEGTVATEERKKRAVELAETTVGVEAVRDRLEVQNKEAGNQ